MPRYLYECKKCKGQVEIDRKISQSDSLPTEEEMKDMEDCDHDLQKLMGDFTLTRTPGYGVKGGW